MLYQMIMLLMTLGDP